MKRLFNLLAFLITAWCLAAGCSSNKKSTTTSENVYKGRLEIKAMCMNYTIKLLDGNLDTSRIVANWTDESAGKAYTNVFALGNPCSFPDSIGQGKEFYFEIDTTTGKQCAVCMAYYPVPPRSISIRVVEKK